MPLRESDHTHNPQTEIVDIMSDWKAALRMELAKRTHGGERGNETRAHEETIVAKAEWRSLLKVTRQDELRNDITTSIYSLASYASA